jgi:hypothetical protein
MFAHTEVFEAGQYYTEELERLTSDPSLTDPAEMALLVTQVDIILNQMMLAMRPYRSAALSSVENLSGSLVHLFRNDQPREMMAAGVEPMMIRGLRKRKATMFARHLCVLRATVFEILAERCRSSLLAGELPCWIRCRLGYVKAWYLLALLSEMPIAYRWGFDVDAASTLSKLVRLLGGRPRF